MRDLIPQRLIRVPEPFDHPGVRVPVRAHALTIEIPPAWNRTVPPGFDPRPARGEDVQAEQTS